MPTPKTNTSRRSRPCSAIEVGAGIRYGRPGGGRGDGRCARRRPADVHRPRLDPERRASELGFSDGVVVVRLVHLTRSSRTPDARRAGEAAARRTRAHGSGRPAVVRAVDQRGSSRTLDAATTCESSSTTTRSPDDLRLLDDDRLCYDLGLLDRRGCKAEGEGQGRRREEAASEVEEARSRFGLGERQAKPCRRGRDRRARARADVVVVERRPVSQGSWVPHRPALRRSRPSSRARTAPRGRGCPLPCEAPA